MRKKKSLMFIVLFIIVALIFISSCKKKGETKAKEKIIKIGAILPLTGPGSIFAQYIKEGLDMKVKEINKQNKTKFMIVYRDSKNKPKEALAVYKELSSLKKIKIVIVALSSVAKALAPLASRYRVFQIYIAVAIPNITDGHFRFRIYPEAYGMAGVMAKFCAKKLNAKKAGVIYINDDFGKTSLEAFKTEFSKYNGKVVISESYNLVDTNLQSKLYKFKNKNLDIIYLNGYGISYGTIVKKIKENKISAQITGDMTMGLPNTLNQIGQEGEGVYFVDGEIDNSFIKKFKKIYGKEPSSYSGYAYDIISILYDIYSKYNNLDIRKIRKGLLSIKKYKGVMGVISINNDGDSNLKFVVKQIINGKPKVVQFE